MVKLSTPILVIGLLQTLAMVPCHAQVFLSCSGDTNYTATSQFKHNLDLLLANLSTVPATSPLGHFHSASYGGPDAAYGLVQCRGDVTPAGCAACLNSTASEVVPRCPFRRVAAIRHDECLLRYSDRSLLGVAEHGFKTPIANGQNVSDLAVFDRQQMDLVAAVTSRAAAGASRFAVGTNNYSYFRDIYGLAQCTRDLSEGDCNQCLRDLIPYLPSGKIGGQVSAASCILRFEIYPFFSLSVVPPPPPPPPPPESLRAAPPTVNDKDNSTGGRSGSDGRRNNSSKLLIIVIISVVVAAVSIFFNIIICLKGRSIRRVLNSVDEQPIRRAESLLFDFGTLRTATENFCDANKLGEGGFGPVYKGLLLDGQQIAVKRLSRRSGQGLLELRNEVALVAKLQHRNLVRLLGFCLEEEEKMVVYEYLPNTSLDKFLFRIIPCSFVSFSNKVLANKFMQDPIRRLQLDWERRYKLIEGIARGLLYLHEDSRLRIIHRDLKASNILLDEHMNPKISDFGLAKLYGIDETHGNTSRIAGTYGYMAPEYAMHGHFSTKSDVFSFGVLALEILTGRKNSGFHGSGNATDLLNYVWYHWNEGAALQLLDPSIAEQCQRHEVLRCIHIGLLCVQEDPSERPNMSTVALMLSSFSLTLHAPSRPAFFVRGSETSRSDVRPRNNNSAFSENNNTSQNMGHSRVQSANEVTISDLEPR